jgi:hypothetical protein
MLENMSRIKAAIEKETPPELDLLSRRVSGFTAAGVYLSEGRRPIIPITPCSHEDTNDQIQNKSTIMRSFLFFLFWSFEFRLFEFVSNFVLHASQFRIFRDASAFLRLLRIPGGGKFKAMKD